jgi:hypothetical protein
VGAVGYTAYVAISGTEFNTGNMLLAAGGGATAGALIGTGFGIAQGMSAAAATSAAVTTTEVVGTVGVACGGSCDDEAQKVVQAVQEVLPAVSNSAQTVYRGLAVGENPAVNGFWARAVDAGNSAIGHVAGKIDSQWISVSKDFELTMEKWGKNGVAEINLSKVGSEIIDFSQGIPGMEGTMVSNWARKYQEILIKNYIPPEAIIKIITGKE